MFLQRLWLICRVCMQQKHGMLDLFSEVLEKPIWNILRDCGGIPVRRRDNLPDKICDVCLDRLFKAYAFRLECQRAHRQITQVVQPNTKHEQEFLTDHEMDTPLSLDAYHQQVIERFEMKNGYHRDSIESLDTASSLSADTINAPKLPNSTKSSSNSLKEDDYVSNNVKDGHYSTRPLKKRIIMSYRNAKDPLRNKTKARHASADLLRHHKYVHRRPHLCKICGKTFSQVQQLQNHENSHTGERPYPCRMCNRIFADTSNRNKHEINIHKRTSLRKLPRRIQCLICNKVFKRPQNLRDHHRRVHLKALLEK
ncbi:protein snail homolog Sna isoform X2 [Musca domestica]|uniref:Protein snail homolog Sna isoform X2 n=1 Tax=Musca domestica TaxID=7370 RepID=A0A1I8NK56_MUSDO|nr:protein snail homolog Sna isoform X2 [Musca domestica]